MMPLASQYIEALAGNKESLEVLDIAAGSGEPSVTVAKAHPEIHITLTDLAPEMVAQARARAQAQDVQNIRYCPAWDACMNSKFAQNGFCLRILSVI